MKIGVIVAMDSEFGKISELLGGETSGEIGENEVVLSRCGIGKVNAALGTQRLLAEYAPDCIVNTGVAGGIDASLQVMDVVAGKEVCYHDVWCGDGNALGQVQGMPARFSADPHLLECAQKLDGVKCGLICCGDKFITNRGELDRIKRDFPEGLAVDMESAAIAQTCYLNKVPFLCLRTISDTPGATENHWQQYQDFWGEMANKSFRFVEQFLGQL